MRLRQVLLVALLAVAGLAQAQMPQLPPIPVDKAVRVGKLSNGLTYYIRHNEYPAHVANFYIAQRVGSINENDDQRGLAHFLEHMAFNGSEHFKGNGIIDFTRSLGVEFGSDLNAFTAIDKTVYRVCDVPTTRQTALDSCLLILKDWSNGLSLNPKDIDDERGVIHGEWAMRNSASQRMFENALPKLYPGSKYGERLPIGLMSIVDSFKPLTLRHYYEKWYRPDNQAIIVVGDIDVDHTEAMIKQLFGGIKVPANAAKVVAEPVPDNAKPIYIFEKDKEQQYSTLGIEMKSEAVPDSEKTNIGYMVDSYVKNIITSMLSSRFNEMSQKEDCPFTQCGASYGNYILAKTKDALSVDAAAKEGKDMETLAAMMKELQRARQFGFTATEYARAKAEFMSVVEKEYSNRNKKKNAEYGDAYRDNYLDNEPIPSSEDEYQIWKMLVPQLPVEAINMAAKELISDNDTNLVVFDFAQEKAGLTYPTTATMQETVNKARAEKLQPWVDNVKNEPLITTMPKKGSIVKETENKTLGYKELKLSNGATVILKKTDFKDDEVQMQAVSKGGESLYGPADYANLKAFDYVMSASGLGNFSNTELEKALAGKQASASVALGLTRQYVNGQTTPTDIETMMQLVYLNFTNIKKDEKSYNSLMSTLSLQLKNKDLMPESALQDTVTNAINRYNPRFANLDVADLDKVSYDRILQIAKERLANAGQFVFTFVGNFDEAKLRPLIEQYIASLPSTGKVDNFKDVRTFAKGDKTIEFSRKMETPKPYVMEWYSNKMPYTLENSIKTDAVGQVVSMILLKTVREDASAAYSVGAYGSCNISGNDCYINMMAYAPISDPTKVNLAKDLIKKGFAEASVKMDADMVQKVKDYMLKNADESAKKNGHWMSILTTYKDYGLDFQSNYKKIVSELTPQSLSAFLKNVVLAGKNHIEVVMRPEEAKK